MNSITDRPKVSFLAKDGYTKIDVSSYID